MANNLLKRIESDLLSLSLQDQLKMLEIIIHNVKEKTLSKNIEYPELIDDLENYYGIAHGLWDEDAQNYVNLLREDRH